MTPNLPFPAVVTWPDGSTVGGARVDVRDGEGGRVLRAWTVERGKVVLVLAVPIGDAEVLAPTRADREWSVETEQGVYRLRRGGCP